MTVPLQFTFYSQELQSDTIIMYVTVVY